MRLIASIAVILIAGCAATTQLLPIPYVFADKPQQAGLTVSYSNASNRSVCLAPDQWPNQAGWVDQAEGRVFLRVGPERFSMKLLNTGHCPACATKVKPGETVTAFVPYEHFGLPQALAGSRKRLEFEPVAFSCRDEILG